MDEIFATGRVVDWIVGLVVLEIAALLLFQRLTRAKVAPMDVLCGIASGAFLLVALRAALVGQAWSWIALFLLAAFSAHLLSLWYRLRNGVNRRDTGNA